MYGAVSSERETKRCSSESGSCGDGDGSKGDEERNEPPKIS